MKHNQIQATFHLCNLNKTKIKNICHILRETPHENFHFQNEISIFVDQK